VRDGSTIHERDGDYVYELPVLRKKHVYYDMRLGQQKSGMKHDVFGGDPQISQSEGRKRRLRHCGIWVKPK